MSKIFELFGYPLKDQSPEAMRTRQTAQCPFMGKDCDGGGNRHLSNIHLEQNAELADFFPGRTSVPSGVCSLQLKPNTSPWIICPRRLFSLAKSETAKSKTSKIIEPSWSERFLLEHSGYSPGTKLSVWSEVRITYRNNQKSFQYTFDYILLPTSSLAQHQIEQFTGIDWNTARRLLKKSGYSIAQRNGIEYVDNFPNGNPVIVEVMTSSTSGGNKTKRTAIPLAFEDAILGRAHNGPGVNYRQVWARMMSQLIAKSEVGLAWGGKTIWILQDVLVNYISSSTALDIHQFRSEKTDEVNILSFSYGDCHQQPKGLTELQRCELFAGPISSGEITAPSFQDMVRPPVIPPKSVLFRSLLNRSPDGSIVVP